ncbi:tRNA pseudouridine(13) synthase TruD [Vibrio sp. SCSIO 43136]|uniref:tRNA pseudouridine(13) synthase TruD n=1 Tax=Vibrio sp. SCSIO 43136 TaxID=2819101 RepID=UPI002074BF75|nr:tRNA pseudouridine(13) synthase TruD [Vibrio sp. SCSIO 43136]USD65673.1 tRNA pseudouridine(13) synthase TruD [Vibrio sp. SCSIO 43136]
MTDVLAPFAYLNGKPTSTAKLKLQPQHFVVREQLGYTFSGEGEHLMLRIRKTGENTSFVANELAKACGVKSKDVSWAGLKDRHAVTEQWLSVHLPGKEQPDLSAFLAQYPSIEILAVDRHNKKLRPGDLTGNEFEVTLAEVTEPEAVLAKLEQMAKFGVPNYFGAQRFGRDGNNLEEARRWGRENVRTRNQNKRSLMLSTARSWIFNRVLSERIEQGCFQTVLLGDLVQTGKMLEEASADNLAELQAQVDNGQAQITAPLAGDNALPTKEVALALENPHLEAEADLMALIRGNRMRHERRALALKPSDLTWQHQGDNITLKFSLPAGNFATSLVRELAQEITVERSYDN